MTDTGYTNPIIPGFHPDPSVCRLGDEYFLATSSFTYFPGVPIFRSGNLIDWVQVGNALDRPSTLDLSGTEPSSSLGIFAPTLRYHDGRFWMITTLYRAPGRPDNYLVTTDDPGGTWSEPVRISIRGIDPDLAWDDDGTCWVHYSNGVQIERVAADPLTGEILQGPDPTWSGTGLQYPEAPHLFQRDGTWYLIIAEGGTERGHSVSIARGPSSKGPWESCPRNPILSHRSTNRPIQNTGHADLVEASDGSWWMVLLGTRPRGGSPQYHVLGRETFLAPVSWIDGWPQVAPLTLHVDHPPPAPRQPRATSNVDQFEDDQLDVQWISVRQAPTAITSLNEKSGWLTIFGAHATLDSTAPRFVGRRQEHERCRASTLVDVGDADEAGLAIRMDERCHYEVAVCGDRVVVKARIGPLSAVVAEAQRPAEQVVLFLETKEGGFGPPDVIVLGYHDEVGLPQELAELDGRFLSTEVAGGMLGRVIGIYAVGGQAAFDWFEYREVPAEQVQ